MVRRGFIYLAALPDVEGERTTLVVSADAINEHLRPVVVQVTSTHRIRPLPTVVPLRAGEGGLTENSYALCHEVHALDEELISEDPLGPMVPLRRLVAVEEALKWVLDLDAAAA